MKQYFAIGLIALSGGITALAGARMMGWGNPSVPFSANHSAPVHFANYLPGGNAPVVADFTFAAEKSLPEVVHISASVRMKRPGGMMQGFDLQNMPEPFRQFFGGPGLRQPMDAETPDDMQEGTGSGVILSSNGYIVTNNHVVRDAEALIVTLNDRREFKATVIGTDPSTDLALVKIDADELPYMPLGNSDHAKVGEWVLAIGNPFNLASTVTAGIVSAKGRDLHIVQDKAPIESFIQTDAVVNPGNSGGALVNLNGELIGINTAIASPTGVFAGYAFAIPSNLVSKVVEDLRQFGVVQRGYLGIIIRDQSRNKSNKISAGVYVDSLAENSAAGAAGVKPGDLVTKIDGQEVNTPPELLEIIGKHRPGDQLTLSVLRDGSSHEFKVTLKNRTGNTDVVKKPEGAAMLNTLGAEFETLSKSEARKLGLTGGIQVKSLNMGKLANQTDMHEGFIITKVSNQPVSNVEDLSNLLQSAKGGVMLEGVYPNNPDRIYYYAFGL